MADVSTAVIPAAIALKPDYDCARPREAYHDHKEIEQAIHDGVMQGIDTTSTFGSDVLQLQGQTSAQVLTAVHKAGTDSVKSTGDAEGRILNRVADGDEQILGKVCDAESSLSGKIHNAESSLSGKIHNAEARLANAAGEGFRDVAEYVKDAQAWIQRDVLQGFGDVRREVATGDCKTEGQVRETQKDVVAEAGKTRGQVREAQKEILLEGCKSENKLMQILLEQFGKDRVEQALYFGKIEKDALQNKFELSRQLAECCCKTELMISELSGKVAEGFARAESERIKCENSDLKLKLALAGKF